MVEPSFLGVGEAACKLKIDTNNLREEKKEEKNKNMKISNKKTPKNNKKRKNTKKQHQHIEQKNQKNEKKAQKKIGRTLISEQVKLDDTFFSSRVRSLGAPETQ